MAKISGRGTALNPAGRFESLSLAPDIEDDVCSELEKEPRPQTEFFKDASKSVVTRSNSPDLGGMVSVNPYRGCEHGCIYCFARPYHEYLNLSSGLDFETKIFVKEDAPALLRQSLTSARWQPEIITMSGITDPYQPVERKLMITRRCLEVLAEFKNPVSIITKNYLVTRDIDYLSELARHDAAEVNFSVTSLDAELVRRMEPRTSTPRLRLKGIEALSKAGIPVRVMMAPIIPGLNDREIPDLLKAAADAGARSAGHTLVRLPYGVKDLFVDWLGENYPLRKEKVLSHIREARGGKLNDSEFYSRFRGQGAYAANITQMFRHFRKIYGLNNSIMLSTAAFKRPTPQPDLFEN